MRQDQLIGQIARKFENFGGLSPLFMSTSPLGNSEIPDPTRHDRMLAMEQNFEKKTGFKAPNYVEVTDYIRALLAGRQPPPQDTRWRAAWLLAASLPSGIWRWQTSSMLPTCPASRLAT